MTNLEALKAAVAGYPLTDNNCIKALTDRGITYTGTYAGKGEAFELAQADMYVLLATAGSISESGFSASVNEKAVLLKLANSIYATWGYPAVGEVIRKVKAVYPW